MKFGKAQLRSRISPITVLTAGGILLLFTWRCVAKDIIADATVDPSETDNFYEARTRLWISGQTQDVRGILVVLGGTDSDTRGRVAQKQWQGLAQENNLALLGCYFRGDGEPYEDASKGSGEALLKMIDQFAESTGLESLKTSPLVIVGHSSGAMFGYNFACWKPERTAAFIAVKTGPILPAQDSHVAAVPALFIVGNHDEGSRVSSAANVFAWGRKFSSRWALAVEPNAGHEWTPAISNLISIYLKDVLSAVEIANNRGSRAAESMGYYCNLQSPLDTSSANKEALDTVWLPGRNSAEAWRKFTTNASLKVLAARPVEVSSPLRISPQMLNLGTARFDSVKAYELKTAVDLKIDGKVPSEYAFIPNDQRLAVTARKVIENTYRLDVRLQTTGLPAGIYRFTVNINCGSKDSGEDDVSIPVIARIASSFLVTPSSFYLGVLSKGQIVEKSFTIASPNKSRVNVFQINSSNPQFVEVHAIDSKPGTANFECRFGGNSARGNQSGFINVILNDSSGEKIRIPYIAFVLNKRVEQNSAQEAMK
jgi:pimeloyl-ACP methyl ester carboxylesterase